MQIFQDLGLIWFGVCLEVELLGFYENSAFILEELSYCFHRNCVAEMSLLLLVWVLVCCISRLLFCYYKVECFVSSSQLFPGA